MFDPSLQEMVWNSSNRAAFTYRLVGLLLIAIGLQDISPRCTLVAFGGAVLAIAAFTITGHTPVNVRRAALAAESPLTGRPLNCLGDHLWLVHGHPAVRLI
jgi:O-antigen ligase